MGVSTSAGDPRNTPCSVAGAADRHLIGTLHYPNLGFSGKPRNLWRMSRPKFTKADDLFRQLLKRNRISKGLTQAELAGRLGQPQSHVSKYELGERRLDFLETVLICQAMGVDFVEFAASFVSELKKSSPRTK
jgi:hypothetical protein